MVQSKKPGVRVKYQGLELNIEVFSKMSDFRVKYQGFE